MVKKLMEHFFNKNSKKKKKKNQKEFTIEKIIKTKDDKLCVSWKEHDNSFNSCINKKDLV